MRNLLRPLYPWSTAMHHPPVLRPLSEVLRDLHFAKNTYHRAEAALEAAHEAVRDAARVTVSSRLRIAVLERELDAHVDAGGVF